MERGGDWEVGGGEGKHMECLGGMRLQSFLTNGHFCLPVQRRVPQLINEIFSIQEGKVQPCDEHLLCNVDDSAIVQIYAMIIRAKCPYVTLIFLSRLL